MNKAIQYALVAIALVILAIALMKSGLLNLAYTKEGGQTALNAFKMMRGGNP